MAQKIAALELKLKALESALHVTGSSVVIKSQGSVSIEAATVAIKASATMELKGSVIKLN